MSKNLMIGKTLAGLSLVLLLGACANEKMEMPAPMMAAAQQPAPAAAANGACAARLDCRRLRHTRTRWAFSRAAARTSQNNVGDKVFFAYDRSDIDDGSRATLQKQAAWLQSVSGCRPDHRGSCRRTRNARIQSALSARRAQAVKDYLASLGVSGARLETISYGKERPVCVQSDECLLGTESARRFDDKERRCFLIGR